MRAAVFTLALAVPFVSFAQEGGEVAGFDAHGYALPASDGDILDPLTLWRSERQDRNTGAIMATFEYAYEPLVQYELTWDDQLLRSELLDNLVGVNVAGHYAPHERVAIAVNMPLWFYSDNLTGQGAGLGDLSVAIPIGLALPKEGAKVRGGLSLVPFIKAPTGSVNKFMGTPGVSGGGSLVSTIEGGRISSTLSVGVDAMAPVESRGITWGTSLIGGASFGVKVAEPVALHVEVNARHVFAEQVQPLTGTPIEALLTARGATKSGFRMHGGVGTSLTPGAGASTIRAFLGAGYAFGKGAKRPQVEVVDASEPAPAAPPAPEPPVEEAPVEVATTDMAAVQSSVVEEEPAPAPSIALDDIRFGFDSAELSATGRSELDKLVSHLNAYPDVDAVRVYGSTDSIGEDGYNIDLARRRIGAVVAYLQRKGVDTSGFEQTSLGESCPQFSNASASGRAGNRAVRILIGEGGAPSCR